MSWPAGHTIFKQGEAGSDLFLVLKGRASVYLTTAGPNIRLITFAPGSVFGELAILDQGRRAATVVADEDMEAFALSAAAFAELGEREPEVAIKLLTALGRELSDRLRRANRTIHELET
jgi:CRP-like cAMP-binding protein